MKKLIQQIPVHATRLLTIVLTAVQPLYCQQALKLFAWFTAEDVNSLLSNISGLDSAVDRCKGHGVTKVYLEAYGRGDYADRKTILEAKTLLGGGKEIILWCYERMRNVTNHYGPVALVGALSWMLNKGVPVVVTDGLAKRLADRPDIFADKHLTVLRVGGSSKKLLKLSREAIKPSTLIQHNDDLNMHLPPRILVAVEYQLRPIQ